MDYRTINNYAANIIRAFDKNSGKEVLQYAVGALLYMPGTNTKISKKILKKENPNIKSLVLCLEDSIGDSIVEQAEECVKNTLIEIHTAITTGRFSISDLPLIFIRVREIGQMTRLVDKCGDSISTITGFVLPKFNKINASNYINEFEQILDSVDTSLYLMPIIESRDIMHKPTRLENLCYIHNALKKISDRTLCIRVGGTDFCNIFGIRRPINSTIWDIRVISDCISDIINIFGTDYVVSGPTWEFFEKKDSPSQTDWVEGLNKELFYDRLNGIIGKTCIHPTQVPYVQQSLIVSETDYTNALQILSMSSQSFVGVKKGTNGNQMNESKTHINWAKKILALSGIYGIKKEI
ncbi:MAG: HpcH/HpaI aldolase/citrate lyase family protein [Clostridia bacterium]|nr:HpcH/HpaI aldolase/citrate lyase family protein [Clostridia bacterium]